MRSRFSWAPASCARTMWPPPRARSRSRTRSVARAARDDPGRGLVKSSKASRRRERNPQTPARSVGASPRVLDTGSWTVIAIAAITLLWVAVRLHRIGDYYTESDFYG